MLPFNPGDCFCQKCGWVGIAKSLYHPELVSHQGVAPEHILRWCCRCSFSWEESCLKVPVDTVEKLHGE